MFAKTHDCSTFARARSLQLQLLTELTELTELTKLIEAGDA